MVRWSVSFYLRLSVSEKLGRSSTRLHTMGTGFFGEGREAFAWAQRMAKLLKKPNGVFRVLHAAAAMKAQRTLTKPAKKKFCTFRESVH